MNFFFNKINEKKKLLGLRGKPSVCVVVVVLNLGLTVLGKSSTTDLHFQPSFCLLFWNKISLSCPGYPCTHSIGQEGLELLILLLGFLRSWDYRTVPIGLGKNTPAITKAKEWIKGAIFWSYFLKSQNYHFKRITYFFFINLVSCSEYTKFKNYYCGWAPTWSMSPPS